MQNEKERTQPSDTSKDDVVVVTRVPSAQSHATTEHHPAEPHATVKDQPVHEQYWEDEEEEEDEFRSCLVDMLTNPVRFWLTMVPLLAFIVHMITWRGWPWNSKPPCVAQSIKLTRTADATCIEFRGVSTICWDRPSKEGDAVEPSAWKIDPASGQITITEQHVL